MNYQRYIDIDVVNGPGTRCTLFVSGCEHHCPGCYNASTWRANSGRPFTNEVADQIIADLSDTTIPRRGLSLSGGDPLFRPNCGDLLKLLRRVKDECPNKDVWMWTGYRVEDLSPEQQEVLNFVDVLIDGPFVQAEANPSLRFRGSSNQRILTKGEFPISA